MNPLLIAIIGLGIGAWIYTRKPHHSAKASPTTAPARQQPSSSPTPPVPIDHIDIAVPAPVPNNPNPSLPPKIGDPTSTARAIPPTIDKLLGPDWQQTIRRQIDQYCFKSSTGRAAALKFLEDTIRYCNNDLAYNMCAANTQTLTNPKGLEVIDRNAFDNEWKTWVRERSEKVQQLIQQLAFRNKYSQTYVDPAGVENQIRYILNELSNEGFGPAVFFGTMPPGVPSKAEEVYFLQDILGRYGWNVPQEKLERPAEAGQSNYALYMESLQHINAVITSKWAAAGCK